MNYLYLSLISRLQRLMAGEEGQDLVEYALLVCLIALAVVGGVKGVATAIGTVFTRISSSLV
jgi:Flp pilus assembly pilin Flp